MANNKIIINLSESLNAKAFGEQNLIHTEEFKKATGWIEDRIKKVETEKPEELKKVRLHDTITILGSRGSGKTTFLYSLLEHYRTSSGVVVLSVIDPTLIEEKGHIFLTVLSQIKKEVECALSKSDCNPESSGFHERKEWMGRLKKLAAGLPSIDGVGRGYDDWQDPEFIMDKGLTAVQAAKELEANFHALLELGLKILGKKIFILALDDIDIDFRRGWPVLEMIRKYLTSPLIVTVISGDLELFSKAIRKQQWKNFGKALLKNEAEQLRLIGDYNDLVTEMEGQYLQKVLPTQRRIHLTTLQEKISLRGWGGVNIFVNKEDIHIVDYYNQVLATLGIKNPYQQEAYRTFLLSLPLRSQIQFLYEFESKKENEEADVIDVFLSDLYEKRVNVDVAKSSPKYLNIIILQLLLQEHVLEGAYQLQPTTTDGSLNSSLTALSILFSQRSAKHPYLIFDYLIRVGYVRNLHSILPYKNEIDSNLAPSIEGLCKHSSLFFDRVYRDILGSMTAYIKATLNYKNKEYKKPWGGAIPIYAMSNANSVENVFKNAPEWQRWLAYIPISVSQPNHKQAAVATFSLYLLLAAIGELIKQCESYVYDDKETIDENIGKILGELSQIRSYNMPAFEFNLGEAEDSGSNEERDKHLEENPLIHAIRKWIQELPQGFNVSPHMLGKMSTRLFYALRNLENREESTNLGEAIHKRLIILFNTVLVEEARENTNDFTLSNNNPVNNIAVFIDNLNAFSEENIKEQKLFMWLLSSPLLYPFLNFNEIQGEENVNLESVIKKVCPSVEFSIQSLYTLLSKVLIQNKPIPPIRFYCDTRKNNQNEKTIDQMKKGGFTYQKFMSLTGEDAPSFNGLDVLFNNNLNDSTVKKFQEILRDTKRSW